MFSLTRDASEDLDAMAASTEKMVVAIILSGVAGGLITMSFSIGFTISLLVATVLLTAQVMEIVLGLLVFVFVCIFIDCMWLGVALLLAALGGLAYTSLELTVYIVAPLALGAASFGYRLLYQWLSQHFNSFKQRKTL